MMDVERREAIRKAAKLILGADFMIAATGAGMSADSGLPVYRDTQRIEAYVKRRLSYMDLCNPQWNFDEPETFYGFWGSSMKQFRDAIPHEGYDILKKWRNELFSESSTDFQDELLKYEKLKGVTKPPGPFFVYTSNVDALHLKAGFHKNEIYEIHGNIETWQCSRPCCFQTWKAPADFEFKVDPITMLAEKGENEDLDFTRNNGFVSNHPRCKFCGDYARPSILMFGDLNWIHNKSLWSPWRSSVSKMLEENASLSAVIVEIGCGKNVPSVRCMGEHFLDSVPSRQCHLIRINCDFINPDYTMNPERVIGIEGRGKAILQAIDAEIQELLRQEQQEAPETSIQNTTLQTDKLPQDEAPKNDKEDEELAYELRVRAHLE